MDRQLLIYHSERIIVVEPNVIRKTESFRQLKASNPESGGVLLGEWRGVHMRVTSLTEPQNGDQSSRFSFSRCGQTHSKLIKKHWDSSNGEVNYLGEWHTHPEDYPKPSSIDKKNWRVLSGSEPVLLMIQGLKGSWWGLLHNNRLVELGRGKLLKELNDGSH